MAMLGATHEVTVRGGAVSLRMRTGEVMAAQQDLVEVVTRLRQVLCVKG